MQNRELASGFCIYGEQQFIDLSNSTIKIESTISPNTEYYIYSNISNLDDNMIDKLNEWDCIKEFNSGDIFIKILKCPQSSF